MYVKRLNRGRPAERAVRLTERGRPSRQAQPTNEPSDTFSYSHDRDTRLGASLYELQWRKADEASRTYERDEAIAWLCHALRRNPSDSVAAARLLSLLKSHSFPVPLLPPLNHEDSLIAVDFGQTGDRFATAT